MYLAEKDVLTPIDDWLATLFAPHRIDDTIRAMHEAQPRPEPEPADTASQTVAECDAKLARYREALETGTDPQLIAGWTAEVQAQRAEALASTRKTTRPRRMSEDEIRGLVKAIGDIRSVLDNTTPEDKGEIYRQLGLTLTYSPGKRTVRAEVNLNAQAWGYGMCRRGDLNPHALYGH